MVSQCSFTFNLYRYTEGYVQSGLLTAVEAEELLAGITRAQR